MNRRTPFLLASLGLLLASRAQALTSDHLQCYKVKDNAAKVAYAATLTPTDPTFAPAPGCTFKTPAKLLCVDTTKTAVSPVPPGAADGDPAQTYLCYKVKCPTSAATKTLTDQFGSHVLTVGKTGLLCAPVDTATAACGDGVIEGAEGCDDGDVASGDGCSSSCLEEAGFNCVGQPSACSPVTVCGDGTIAGAEGCDDGNAASGDGCSSGCTVEVGYNCAGSPSACSATCGDGVVAGIEACDDGNAASGDGCSSGCTVEVGYNCAGSPSACSATCGDGVIAGTEACDDANLMGGDGCSPTCTVEVGYMCVGQPSVCTL